MFPLPHTKPDSASAVEELEVWLKQSDNTTISYLQFDIKTESFIGQCDAKQTFYKLSKIAIVLMS